MPLIGRRGLRQVWSPLFYGRGRVGEQTIRCRRTSRDTRIVAPPWPDAPARKRKTLAGASGQEQRKHRRVLGGGDSALVRRPDAALDRVRPKLYRGDSRRFAARFERERLGRQGADARRRGNGSLPHSTVWHQESAHVNR